MPVETEPDFVPTLSDALKDRMPGSDVMHEQVRGSRYRFAVVWPAFDEMGHPERQRLVWDIAEQKLNASELLYVGMIITLGLEDLPADDAV